ncbi:MAG: DUF1957 domain-containing protein [Verrucomicrobia bacterium]|nr:MAG: DUF1957 domain-containing protein [Verrucomicrobiota bacterium]
MQTDGHLILLLHAHLPFVHHPEHEDFLEEEWLFEAIAETYIPLLKVFFRLAEEGVPFRVTMTLTPSLCTMLRDPLLQTRTLRYLERSIEISRKEIERTRQSPQIRSLAKFYHTRCLEARQLYLEKWRCDLVKAFSDLEQGGHLELITSAATHGLLPLMADFPEAMRAQIHIGADYHAECFGRKPQGFWLPECAYVPSVDQFLREVGLRWFVVDAHGLYYGEPRPRFGIFSPYYTRNEIAFFARDRESSKQVWDAHTGYPGNPVYRDFYRDIGHDLPESIIKDYLPEGRRRATGMKYYRITAAPEKELYQHARAMGMVTSHAQDFVKCRMLQMDSLRATLPVPPVVLSAFDAELFGHWWFEGPEFLDLVIRKTAACVEKSYRLATPSEYLMCHPTLQVLTPSPSSWGHRGYWETWLSEENSWIYPHLHMAARRMIEVARQFRNQATENEERILRQLARELLLAQSSDWAFLIKTGTARNYSTLRIENHIRRFTRLYESLQSGVEDLGFLQECETRDNIFPNLNWRYYIAKPL